LKTTEDRGNPATDGNSYVLDVTVGGDSTFRHVATGEVLHGQVGPWKEAWNLYVTPAGLSTRAGEVVVYDLGLGCGAQLLATLAAFRGNPALRHCTVVSFDLEDGGLRALAAEIQNFPYAQAYAEDIALFLDASRRASEGRGQSGDEGHDALVERVEPDGRTFQWRFVRGDFCETIVRDDLPPADVIFFDFFSPARHPWLWRRRIFEALRERSTERALLFTYTSASAARATLAAGGFFVGLSPPSGKKVKSTVGARTHADLLDPLPASWKRTFLTSHKGFLEGESDEEKAAITERIVAHPQFAHFPY
jgi:tRNA U34 5-methylaminomethyl-2-thiouridine-forming methyltransferase MnmC